MGTRNERIISDERGSGPILNFIFLIHNPSKPVQYFPSLPHLRKLLIQLRPDHNYFPNNAIQPTAKALRKNVEKGKYEGALKKLSEKAKTLWSVYLPV